MHSFIYVRKNREVCVYEYSHNQTHLLTVRNEKKGGGVIMFEG